MWWGSIPLIAMGKPPLLLALINNLKYPVAVCNKQYIILNVHYIL